jgi:hypothetical protein
MDYRTQVDPRWREWATEIQAKYLDATLEHGSMSKAAKALGVNKSVVITSMGYLRKMATRKGYSPQHDLTRPVPDGFALKGVSSYYPPTKDQPGQWVKLEADKERMHEMMQEIVHGFIEELPQIPVSVGPDKWQSDVIPWVQIGDAHIGLLCHASEVGENFDLKIAERELCGAIGILIDELPSCERLVINDLGDATHYQNFQARTDSGHDLDYDTRFPKMIKVYSRVMRFIIEKALEKARHVDVIVNQGNHSRVNDIWLAEMLRVAYGHTGRVHVLNNDSVFIAYRMGKTLVMTHHSDKCRPQHLAQVMTTDFRKDYGETEYHYVDIGHVHHGMVMKEHPGVVVESFNHLAATDKWAHDSGYRARKSITIILRSKTYGEVGRRLLPIQEIRDRLENAKMDGPKEREVYTV